MPNTKDTIYICMNTTPFTHQLNLLTRIGQPTVTNWTNLLREVCSKSIPNLPKLYGRDELPVQTDESRFARKRKYNGGRILEVDAANFDPGLHGAWILGISLTSNDVCFFCSAKSYCRNTTIHYSRSY